MSDCSHEVLVDNEVPTSESGKKCKDCNQQLSTSEYIKWLEKKLILKEN